MSADRSKILRADLPWSDGFVGAFWPDAIASDLTAAFPEAVVCLGDAFEGYREHVLRNAEAVLAEHGRYPHLPVESDLRKIRNYSPRYRFRIFTGGGRYAEGTIDRYTVQVLYKDDDDFPPPFQERFLAFLNSLDLGRPRVWRQ